MRNSSLLVMLVFGSLTAFGQTEKVVDSKITDVTVFLNKAQVTREMTTRLEAGKMELVLSGLTSQLDPSSIQVSGNGNLTILGISHRQNYLTEFNVPPKLKTLKDSLSGYQKQLGLEQSHKEILNKEEQMLLSNQKIGGANQNLTVAELKAMADFFRSRLGEIVSSRMKQDEKLKVITEHIQRLQKQINSENELYSRNTSEIVISVSANNATSATFEINYIVYNANWSPIYDLRAINTKGPIQLNYKANVLQRTGEDWNNVKLTLSTANPNQSGLMPQLAPWYLDFYNPIVYKNDRGRGAAARSAMPAAMSEKMEMEVADEAPALSLSDYVSTVQTSLNTEFKIALPYTVTSSAKPTTVDISKHEIKSDYDYSVVPKLDNDAFLIAKATGWEAYNLLPGEANIFFEGTYVGKTFIDPNSIKDTLSVSLGRDKRIVVKREELKDLTSKRLIGSNQREEHSWQITVRNSKSEPITITVEDQLPVTRNSQIEVSPIDNGGAKFNAVTGKLTWQLTIQPNESKKVIYRYEIKYPKDKQISGL
ncbi:MAG TPA: mucoidy inhibitor MuiA family protein [Cyclobacteriaceae bacterium]